MIISGTVVLIGVIFFGLAYAKNRKASLLFDQYKLFQYISEVKNEKELKKIDEAYKQLEKEKKQAQSDIDNYSLSQQKSIDMMRKQQECVIIGNRESLLRLDHHHRQFVKVINKIQLDYIHNPKVYTILGDLALNSNMYRSSIEDQFQSWFGKSISEHRTFSSKYRDN